MPTTIVSHKCHSKSRTLFCPKLDTPWYLKTVDDGAVVGVKFIKNRRRHLWMVPNYNNFDCLLLPTRFKSVDICVDLKYICGLCWKLFVDRKCKKCQFKLKSLACGSRISLCFISSLLRETGLYTRNDIVDVDRRIITYTMTSKKVLTRSFISPKFLKMWIPLCVKRYFSKFSLASMCCSSKSNELLSILLNLLRSS